MSVNIKTDKETEVRDLTISQIEALIFLIYRSDYRCFFPFAYNDKTESERFVGYAGAIGTKEDDNFLDEPIPKDVDIYLCVNGMKSPYKRTASELIGLQNLVIDIDSHQFNLSIEELNEHIKDFEKKLIDKLIIKPNFVNRTGRGLHLWFCIEACHVSLNKICLSVIDMLCTHIEGLMQEMGEEELSIDRASSLKLNGLFRMPYSYNTKAGVWAEGQLIREDTPNINELRKTLLENGFKSAYFSSEKKAKKRVDSSKYHYSPTIKQNDYTPCLIHRKKFMDYLFRTRNIEVGSRDIMIFAMYSTLIMLMNDELAQEYCVELNDTFKVPLKHYELHAIYKEIDKKQHKFTVERFFDFVHATEVEKEWFRKSTKKEEDKQKKRDDKAERNRKIKEWRANGVSVAEISREVKLSRKGVYNILNATL